jgi:acetylserotonin O-methyltransferase
MSGIANIVELVNGFRFSKVMFASVKLGIFDTLAQHPNGLAVQKLAKELPNQTFETTDGLSRLLRCCVSLNLLSIDNQKRFSVLPDTRKYLTTSSPQSWVGYINHSNDMLYPLWQNLEASVVSGATCWKESFGFLEGGDRAKAFEHIYHGPEGAKRFQRAMESIVNTSATQILKMVQLDWVSGILDLGGSTGRFSSYFLDAKPRCQRAIVFDLPHIVDLAQDMRKDVPINDRVEFLTGSFFEPLPELPGEINAILLSRILHDWDDSTCEVILKNANAALVKSKARRAGVLIFDMLFKDDTKVTPKNTAIQDVNMLVQTVSLICRFYPIRNVS